MRPTVPLPLRTTHSTLPSGRLTSLTCAVILVEPPHAVSWDWSPSPWPPGVTPPIDGPARRAVTELGACWQLCWAEVSGGGGGEMVSRKGCVAVRPLASVTSAVKTYVPVAVGVP